MDALSGFGSTDPNIVRERLRTLSVDGQQQDSDKLPVTETSPTFDANRFAALSADIRAAVENALGAHSGGGSPRESIQAAITDVLRQHGIDLDAVRGPQLGDLGRSSNQPFAGFSAAQVEADALDMLFESMTESDEEDVRSVLGDTFGRLPAGSLFNGQV